MWNWLRSWVGGGADDGRVVDEELRAHLEMQTDDLIRQGMEPAQARREALRRFGNPVRVRERVRAERGLAWMDEILRNLRFAVRSLVRNPVFAVTVVLTTAGTVALGSTAWAVGDATLWRGLPWPDADRLLQVGLYDGRAGGSPSSLAVDGATWEQVRDRAPDLQAAAYAGWVTGVNLSTDGAAALRTEPARRSRILRDPRRISGTGSGVHSRGGRYGGSGSGGAKPHAVAEHLRRRSGDRGPDHPSEGRAAHRNRRDAGGIPHAVRSGRVDAAPTEPDGRGERDHYAIVARVPAGLTRPDAILRIEAIPAPDAWLGGGGEPLMGAIPLEDVDRAQRRATVGILLGGIALMLLIGWGNLAGLQAARTLARNAEMSTRQALGGGRSALVRQLSVEILLIGGIGGVMGIACALLAAPGRSRGSLPPRGGCVGDDIWGGWFWRVSLPWSPCSSSRRGSWPVATNIWMGWRPGPVRGLHGSPILG